MKPDEFEDAKTLWKMFYAQQFFRRARVSAEHIREEKLGNNDPLFHPLVVSVYVFYGKPFKRARGVGKLDEQIVPKECLDLHKTMMTHRDQVYAHTDADSFQLPHVGPANQVRVLRTNSAMRLFATDFHARHPLMPNIIDLCAKVEKKAGYYVDKIFTKYMKRVPTNIGEYGINITNPKGDFFTKESAIMLDWYGATPRYSVKRKLSSSSSST